MLIQALLEARNTKNVDSVAAYYTPAWERRYHNSAVEYEINPQQLEALSQESELEMHRIDWQTSLDSILQSLNNMFLLYIGLTDSAWATKDSLQAQSWGQAPD